MKVEEELQNSSASKIKLLVNMALKGEISWINLTSLMDDLTPTLKKSKKVNKILLKELETLQSKFKQKQCYVKGMHGYAEPEVINIDEPMEVPGPVVEDDLMIVETREEEANFDEAILNQIIERSQIEQSSINLQTQNEARSEFQRTDEQGDVTSETTNDLSNITETCILNDLDIVDEEENDIELIEEDSTSSMVETNVFKDKIDTQEHEVITNIDAIEQENEIVTKERTEIPEAATDLSCSKDKTSTANDLNFLEGEDIEIIVEDPIIPNNETSVVEDITEDRENRNMESDNTETRKDPATLTEETRHEKDLNFTSKMEDEIEIIEEFPNMAKKEINSTEMQEKIQDNETEGESLTSNEILPNVNTDKQPDIQIVPEIGEKPPETNNEIDLYAEESSLNQDVSEIQDDTHENEVENELLSEQDFQVEASE